MPSRAWCAPDSLDADARHRIELLAQTYRDADPDFSGWAEGYGVIQHAPLTQVRVREMVDDLASRGLASKPEAYRRLAAADRLASAAMWLVVHMTYARHVRPDGEALGAADFKPHPEGHTGGSLNMALAYAGYLLMNALDGVTRSWMMGQGHCVAAIDAINVLTGNVTPGHAARYSRDEAGLTRLVTDFYSYGLNPDGTPSSPLGSHVNAHTAGGILEGGYLGFAELQYVHAPLPGEHLVVFLSDGAFEEQRGSDWAPRWWRGEDCGLVAPIMVLNGRRIEQRSLIAQQGGESWLEHHLRLNGFDPVGVDGRDPASVAWGIHAIESRLRRCVHEPGEPTTLPYGIAETIKGFGFPGAGTNVAHNLPLPGNPADDEKARALFNEGAARLFVPHDLLEHAIATLATHSRQGRVLERDHPLATRAVPCPALPPAEPRLDGRDQSPMEALDAQFVAIAKANPHLRVRVGNPDELRSNRLDRTLDTFRHRVQSAEPGVAESRTGCVITALNEEAVICAALGNSGGLNLVVTYEAFAPKMLGAVRQHVNFARQCKLAGRSPGWRGIPLVLTSHTWENAKNELSHQDPTFVEAWLGEMSDTARVVFPADARSAATALAHVYRDTGHVTALVVPKRPVAQRLDAHLAERLAREGVLVLARDPDDADILLVATGAYQLRELERAFGRLEKRGLRPSLLYLGEPGRFRAPRDPLEAAYVHPATARIAWFPEAVPRVFLTHTRPEPFLGALRPLDTGPAGTLALGYCNRGGTLDVDGLLFANRSTWAHATAAAAQVLGRPASDLLGEAELAALDGTGDPRVLLDLGTHHG